MGDAIIFKTYLVSHRAEYHNAFACVEQKEANVISNFSLNVYLEVYGTGK